MIKGVNLGNWFVLEKWMSPALFEGTTAEDEYNLPLQLSKEVYEARIKIHRSEYISERDFATIAGIGFNTVRIPIPYFIFGDRSPFIGCIDLLDKAFDWAERYGLKILVDLHTAPLSQNGFDNGGICGVCRWSKEKKEVDFVLQVLEKLAKRYGKREALMGITPINEPITEPMWEIMDVPNRYPAADPELAKGSGPNTISFLEDFYTRAFEIVIPYLKENAFVVFHDGFQLKRWKDFLTKDKFTGRVMLDTHMYLMVAEAMGCEQNLEGYLKFIQTHFAKDIKEVQSYVPVLVGEWSLFNSAAIGMDTQGGRSSLNGIDFTESTGMSDSEKKELYFEIAKAQLKAWENGAGYCYWNYKLLLDPVHEAEWKGWDCWDLGKSVDLGWFPEKV